MKNLLVIGTIVLISLCSCHNQGQNEPQISEYNKEYKGEFLNRIAFPIGGMGAVCFVWKVLVPFLICQSGISPIYLTNLACLPLYMLKDTRKVPKF